MKIKVLRQDQNIARSVQRPFTLTVPLSTQVFKWVLANATLFSSVMDSHSIQGGEEILLVTLCYRNRDNLRSDGPRMQTETT